MLNGDGLRVVLWVSGCSHYCKECHNMITWDANAGLLFTLETKKELFDKLSADYISGITFSGGDPLYFENREQITQLAKEIKDRFPAKNIWLYTGYLWEDICNEEIFNYIDVCVDGPYIDSLKDNRLKWCGSSNQRIIDVHKTLKNGTIYLYCKNI